ncbi:hypothetical protein TNCV_1914471 [Trichonephila clavipes]|nr:hypothetical protein TNCV_1914471 [Trichonephila clavipes]
MGRRLHLPGNVDDLSRQLEQIWQEIPPETIRVLYHSMSRRVAACIQARDRRVLIMWSPMEVGAVIWYEWPHGTCVFVIHEHLQTVMITGVVCLMKEGKMWTVKVETGIFFRIYKLKQHSWGTRHDVLQ